MWIRADELLQLPFETIPVGLHNCHSDANVANAVSYGEDPAITRYNVRLIEHVKKVLAVVIASEICTYRNTY